MADPTFGSISNTTYASRTNTSTGTGDPFVDWVNLDFRLTTNTTAGTNLGSPFNTDMLGNTRTTWTRGAIEFVESSPSTITLFLG